MKAPTGLASQVFRLDLWMGSYGARTPKRTRLWSNSKVISGFFTSEKLKLVKHVHYKTTKRYKDSTGQERFQGNKKLTDTGSLG